MTKRNRTRKPKTIPLPKPEDAKPGDRTSCPTCGGPVLRKQGASEIKAVTAGPEIWENLPPEHPVIVGERIRQRIGRKTLVIIGTSPDSCGLTPWNEPYIDGFWSLNDCHHLPFIKPHMDKITGWFQLHHRWRFMRETPRYGFKHWEWLREEHPFPIYMQKKYDDVPSSVKFPLREVAQEFLAGKLGRGSGFEKKYFTCSFGFMAGLAYLQGYNRIEMYGVELAQEFEYMIQRPNTEFWIGLLVGRGVQMYLPQRCRIMQGPFYCYRWPDAAGARKKFDEIRASLEKAVADGRAGAQETLDTHMTSGRPPDDAVDEDNVGFWEDFDDEYTNMHIYDELGLGRAAVPAPRGLVIGGQQRDRPSSE